MLRKLLLPMLATAMLAGCATDYRYRGGNGDYYYGQPRVEYRNMGPGGFYGGIGIGSGIGGYGYGSYGGFGFGQAYYYDRYGRLIHGYPNGYFGSPYYGGNGWYRPRPNHGHGDHNDHDGDTNGADRNDRRPPWRDLRGLQTRDPDENVERDREGRQRPMQRSQPGSSRDAPMRTQPQRESAPVMRERSGSSSRIGGFSGGATRPQGKRSEPPAE